MGYVLTYEYSMERCCVQVHDVKMQNEYNLRLKDAAMHDKVRELTERHAADMGQAEAKSAALQQDMEQQRVQYEEKLQDAAEHQQVLHQVLFRSPLECWCLLLFATICMYHSSPSCASPVILHATLC